jgi:hypothetical protein
LELPKVERYIGRPQRHAFQQMLMGPSDRRFAHHLAGKRVRATVQHNGTVVEHLGRTVATRKVSLLQHRGCQKFSNYVHFFLM